MCKGLAYLDYCWVSIDQQIVIPLSMFIKSVLSIPFQWPFFDLYFKLKTNGPSLLALSFTPMQA